MSDHTISPDGLAVMKNSATPCGLYARQKWLGESAAPSWQADFRRTVTALRHGQGSDGLWARSPLETIRRLFGLHLTVRTPDAGIEKALDALLACVQSAPSSTKNMHVSDQYLPGLPFASCRWLDTLQPAFLFLASIFGRSSRTQIRALYDRSVRALEESSLETARPCWIHNSLRALVVHPDYATHPVTRRIVAWYAQRQAHQGDWGDDIPFYQALNAMAHLESPEADDQCQTALAALTHRQNTDGSWGKQQREWHTFLALHALRNKGKWAPPLENDAQT